MDFSQVIKARLPQKYEYYSVVFRKIKFNELPPSRFNDHRIKLKPDHRLEALPTSTSLGESADLILDYVDGLLSRGLIAHSNAVAASEIYFERVGAQLVPKVSFEKLNAITERTSYELPTSLNVIRNIGNASMYSKLVVQNVYDQILLDIKDAHLTTFLTPFGRYSFRTLPCGLANAKATIQEMVEEIIDYPNKEYVVAYQDNILVYSRNASDHIEHVKDILNCFKEYEILLDINKSEFNVAEVLFLGYKLGNGMFSINPQSCNDIVEAEYPKTKEELKAFLKKVESWGHFVSGYASKAAYLSFLAYKQPSFSWDFDAAEAFNGLKSEFSITRWLEIPDPSLEYMIDLNYNPIAYSATLVQADDEGDPILGYFSMLKTHEQQAFNEVDDQAYGLLLSLEHWKDIIKDAGEAIRVRMQDSPLADMDYEDITVSHYGLWYKRFTEFDFYVTPFDDVSFFQAEQKNRTPCSNCAY